MKIYLANPRGFCAGVDRAVEIVEKSIQAYGTPIYVRHEIVHNKHVVKSLEDKGTIFVNELSEIPDNAKAVIFSAHGVSKAVEEQAKKRNLNIINATCPLVTKVHSLIQKYENSQKHTFVIGHKNHAEVIGTMGQLADLKNMTLISTEKDVDNLQANDYENTHVAFVTQTTLSVNETSKIIAKLKEKLKNKLEDLNSMEDNVCYSTTNRQNAIRELANICDGVIVLGSKNSSNSNRLVDVAKNQGVKYATLIDDASELDIDAIKNFNSSGMTNIGISAGASAPENLVQGVISCLEENFPNMEIENIQTTKEKMEFIIPPKLIRALKNK